MKTIFGLYEPDTDQLVAVVLEAAYVDDMAAEFDLVVEDYEVEDDFSLIEVVN
jgi:hypothetical protein